VGLLPDGESSRNVYDSRISMKSKKVSTSSVLWRPSGRLFAIVSFGPTAPRTPDGKDEDKRDRGDDGDEEGSRTDPEEGLRPPARRGPGRQTGGRIARFRVEDAHVAAAIRGSIAAFS